MVKTASQWHGLYERPSIALSDALEYMEPETPGRSAEHLKDLSSARGAVNAALGDTLVAWNARHPDALLRLPRELTNDVFRRLEWRSRVTVSHVSRGWRDVALSDPFLWNVATFHGREPPVSSMPARRRRGPHTGPLRRKIRILRELLARSASVPFSLTWEEERLPQRVFDIVLQNLHRMQALTVALSRRGFQRLFALPAPELRSLVCTHQSGLCVFPARWDAPVLKTLELFRVRFPAEGEIARLDSIKELFWVQATGLEQRGTKLFAVFPALTTLEIAVSGPEMITCLSDVPATLSNLTLRAYDSFDHNLLLAAFCRCSPRLLRLLSLRGAADVAPVLALFVSIISGTWTMEIHPHDHPHAGFRANFLSDAGGIAYTIDGSEVLSFVREPRIASYLNRLASLTVLVPVLAQLDALAQWERCLPALRTLALICAQRTAWPASAQPPISAPNLERVSIFVDVAPSWVTQRFPEVLKSRFLYTRPLLERIEIETKNANGLQEKRLAELRALTEVVIVQVGHETRVYAHQ